MTGQLVLSLFPGIGLLDAAFEEAGACVVRGPDTLWGGDIKDFHAVPGRFDGVIGGPPCQAFSRLRHIVEANGYTVAENLIPHFERVVAEAAPRWFLMENVPAAPPASVAGYGTTSAVLNNRWVGGIQQRIRRFTFGIKDGHPRPLHTYLDVVPLEAAEYVPAVVSTPAPAINGSGFLKASAIPGKRQCAESIAEKLRRQGFPEDLLDHAPFTSNGKHQAVANGVPLSLGRALAAAVARALAEAAS